MLFILLTGGDPTECPVAAEAFNHTSGPTIKGFLRSREVPRLMRTWVKLISKGKIDTASKAGNSAGGRMIPDYLLVGVLSLLLFD